MAEYGNLNRKNYKKLYDFLDENNLQVLSNFIATDMDCAFKITSKDYEIKSKVKETDWYVTFLFEAYQFTEFTFDLGLVENMNEDTFIDKLNKINKRWCKYLTSYNDLKSI